VVIGGGIVGAETAEHLAVHGCTVTIVKRSADIAGDLPGAPRHFLMESLKRYDAELLENTKTLEITENGVLTEKNGIRRLIPADLVVLASGSRSNNALAKELEGKYPVTVVGDAFAVGKALDGIDAAYKAALEL
jgi:NADPH-dependent 2,4-dienoyl-CoA reductase/sulfur reductase-like enzyme